MLWAGLQSLEQLTHAGVCAGKEEQIDEDLRPWESTGGVITEEQVRDMSSEAAWSRYCNRVIIVNNSLFIVWAHQVAFCLALRQSLCLPLAKGVVGTPGYEGW